MDINFTPKIHINLTTLPRLPYTCKQHHHPTFNSIIKPINIRIIFNFPCFIKVILLIYFYILSMCLFFCPMATISILKLCISHLHGASLIAQLVKNSVCNVETLVRFLDWKIPWRRDRLPTPVFLGFPGGSAGKESTCNAGDLGLISGWGRSPREGKGYPLQYSGLENTMAWIVHGVTKSQTQLSDFHFHSFAYYRSILICYPTSTPTPASVQPISCSFSNKNGFLLLLFSC